MKRSCAKFLLLGAVALLAGCYSHGESAPAPTGLAVAAGDGGATLSWNMDSGVTYWVWCALGTSITVEEASSAASPLGLQIKVNVSSPFVVSGLANGRDYACTVNGRYNGGPGGPGSPSVTFVPRLAGASWSPGAALGTGNLRGVGYGASFFAVGDAGSIFTSADGKSWTTTTPVTTDNLHAAVYDGIYVVAGQNGTILTSFDALNWSKPTPATTNDLYALATNGSGAYVAVGQAGTLQYSSGTVAQTWIVAADSGTASDNLTGATYGTVPSGSQFVAVSDQGRVLTSRNGGASWTLATVSATPLYAVTYGVDNTVTPYVGRFVAVGAAGTVLTSTDGATWIAQASLGVNTLRAITYGHQFVAVGDAGSVYTSADGLTWQPQVSGTTTQDLLAIAHSVYSTASSTAFGYSVVGSSGTNLAAY